MHEVKPIVIFGKLRKREEVLDLWVMLGYRNKGFEDKCNKRGSQVGVQTTYFEVLVLR